MNALNSGERSWPLPVIQCLRIDSEIHIPHDKNSYTLKGSLGSFENIPSIKAARAAGEKETGYSLGPNLAGMLINLTARKKASVYVLIYFEVGFELYSERLEKYYKNDGNWNEITTQWKTMTGEDPPKSNYGTSTKIYAREVDGNTTFTVQSGRSNILFRSAS